jgi:DNA-binding transcriptional LysR family regulator
MSPRHPLAAKARVSLAESVAYPIALPLKNSGSRMLIDIACKAAGIYMLPILETNSIQLRVQFVHVNNGITFHSRLSAADSLSTGDVIAVPIRDRLVNTATIEVITHASRPLSLAGEAFVRFLQGELQNLREPLSSAA